jgi:hypothetical protein
MTLAGFIPIVMNPYLALDIFSLESKLSLPARMAGNNPDLISPIYPGMQTGFFLQTGDRLTHEAQTRDGRLFLNQKEVELR